MEVEANGMIIGGLVKLDHDADQIESHGSAPDDQQVIVSSRANDNHNLLDLSTSPGKFDSPIRNFLISTLSIVCYRLNAVNIIITAALGYCREGIC